MDKQEELRLRILGGKSDANIGFDDLRTLLAWLGFEERSRQIILRYGLGGEGK